MPLTEVVPTDPGALAPPTGRRTLPYSRQQIDDDDVAAVIAALRSDWLTTGPRVAEFEAAFAQATGAREAVALSSGTAALHATMAALDIGPGDEVIVPPLTFAASANCVVYQGGTPVFADVDPGTLLLDPAAVARKLGPRTRAVVAVDYAGQPCDYQALEDVVAGAGVSIVADACH
ncbi:MAG TPA: aminotransferase class I/II-fold pyridoxal phosphate-dependent enzyme, partial [Gemmatimonadaceae bacterium]|nr:aminotransferase class I/II-fold pyridoxal phosphate-dependent enzyme [Gemmatimonadaceae bacterium]